VFVEGMAARRALGWCGRADGRLRVEYIHDGPADLPALKTSVEAACLPRAWGGTGLFVRYYRGQDYYNLGFGESITRLQFGFTLQRATFLSFRIP
jgi:hypothetical protein